MSKSLTKFYAIPGMILASYPLAISYSDFPTRIFRRITGIVQQESGWDWKALNPDGNAAGLYQIRTSSSQYGLKELWLKLPEPISIQLQTLDFVLLHLTKPKGGGVDKMGIQHHGAIKWSEYKKGRLDPWAETYKTAEIPVPTGTLEAMVLIPFYLLA